LLLGLTDTLVAGMVTLRPIDVLTSEMRRLYVRPPARGQGVGRGLVSMLIEEASKAGYAALRLETLEAMAEAQALYRSLGFAPIAPYRPPTNEHDRTLSMELVLHPLEA
jgi:ribosomal protein S18 acetylase RimI-like enzyme